MIVFFSLLHEEICYKDQRIKLNLDMTLIYLGPIKISFVSAKDFHTAEGNQLLAFKRETRQYGYTIFVTNVLPD